ncbi:MAG: helix-turn-helix domain-containing protein [Elusimicrobia bacterium]|nr:helix-turn-helix domain-containing protein [Candidatus Liberimonas magnetica]
MEDELLTPQEVADNYLKCDIRTLRRYINKDLPVVRISPRCIRILKSELIKWINKRKGNS